MAHRIELPPEFAAVAAEFTSGVREPAEPRDAATVVLMRDGSAGPEVYLMRRQNTMAFAGGVCVFPGGGVDPRDHDHEIAWAGPDPAEWATRLGVDEGQARALVCAAVRETFEESGVLLAGPSDSEVVNDTTGADWEADRAALESRDLAMTQFLDRRGLYLRSDLLGVWSGWLTPHFEPRRYRTWFFVADLPEGQLTRDVSSESSEVLWLPAMSAVEQAEAEQISMLPPTYMTCLDIAQYADTDGVLGEAQSRMVDMFTPVVEEVNGAFLLSVPPYYEQLAQTRE
ncbi:MAG TPA: NUDIX domain-containing protein [Marmoricola sp.]|nr:NUDIX domain-containing protein [Marmoricola sp.]